MIEITDKSKCCGCGACYNVCTSNAIAMQEDSEGFLYPAINSKFCTKCGLCIKICPMMNFKNHFQNTDLKVYGAKNKNIEEQKKSSSGGLFSLFANYILEKNGIVFGSAFNDKWHVIHKFIDKKENLDDLRRSKYVQSDIGIVYKQTKKFLEQDKWVLFSGAPCQIAGLKNYLQKDYERLYTMDFICHSVPSPKVWQMFLKQNFDISKIEKINFREKEFRWDKFFLKIYFKKNIVYPRNSTLMRKLGLILPKKVFNILFSRLLYVSFFKAFMFSLISRPSCHNCSFKGKKKQSDITVSDLWGIFELAPELYDKNGVSMVILNSLKGKFLFETVKNNLDFAEINPEKISKFNPCFITSTKPHPKRQDFFDSYQTEPLNDLINRLLHKPFLKRCFNFLKNRLRK
jgi:coenzyme F420-reducing hydrogenase beta subunit